MINISFKIKQGIAAHAQSVLGEEVCGFVINGQVVRCKNDHPSPSSNFAIKASDFVKAEKVGKIQALYHSHPSGPRGYSRFDVKSSKQTNLPWIVFDELSGDFFCGDPTGDAPYEGRQWIYGIHDCYAILKDFYKKEFDIVLDDFERGDEKEWEKNEWQMFARNYAGQGFVEINKPERKGDFLLMQINAPSPNHAGVISGEGWTFYHHLINRKSEKTVYGGYWAKITTKVLRHKRLL